MDRELEITRIRVQEVEDGTYEALLSYNSSIMRLIYSNTLNGLLDKIRELNDTATKRKS